MSIKKSNRLWLAYRDMIEARTYVESLIELQEKDDAKGISEFWTHREAILLGAIITYCRCFKPSNTGGNADACIKPEDIELFKGKSELEQLHDHLVNLRDKAVAHSDWEYHYTEILERDESAIRRKSPRIDYAQGIKISQFLKLIEYVGIKCQNMAFDIDSKGVASK